MVKNMGTWSNESHPHPTYFQVLRLFYNVLTFHPNSIGIVKHHKQEFVTTFDKT